MPADSDERWKSLSEHLDQVLELAEPERVQWLAALERQDPEMAALVARALAAREKDEFANFLEGAVGLPAEELAAASRAEPLRMSTLRCAPIPTHPVSESSSL